MASKKDRPYKFPQECAETALDRHVRRWLNDCDGYTDGAKGRFNDLMHGGCQSGIVSHLIYSADGARFYRRHAREIDAMLRDSLADLGGTISELFGRIGWDDSDPLAREDPNLCILAWFGFEEAARRIADRAGIDI